MDARPPRELPRRAVVVDGHVWSNECLQVLGRLGVQTQAPKSVAGALRLAESHPPDLLVVAPAASDAARLRLAAKLSMRHGTVCVVIVERVDDATLECAVASDARAVLCQPVHMDQFEATFRLALQEGPRDRPHPGEARARLLESALHHIARELGRVDVSEGMETLTPALSALTPREQQVVRMLLQHLRVPSIARRLGITQQTVRNHLKRVFRRTGVRNQQELLDRITLRARVDGHGEESGDAD